MRVKPDLIVLSGCVFSFSCILFTRIHRRHFLWTSLASVLLLLAVCLCSSSMGTARLRWFSMAENFTSATREMLLDPALGTARIADLPSYASDQISAAMDRLIKSYTPSGQTQVAPSSLVSQMSICQPDLGTTAPVAGAVPSAAAVAAAADTLCNKKGQVADEKAFAKVVTEYRSINRLFTAMSGDKQLAPLLKELLLRGAMLAPSEPPA